LRLTRLAYIRNITVRKKRESLLNLLNKAGQELGLSTETNLVLDKISNLIVPQFADWFTINVLKGEHLELVIVKNQHPENVKWAIEHRRLNPITIHDQGLIGHILRTGESSLIEQVTNEMIDLLQDDEQQARILKNMNLKSSIIVPMYIKDRIMGTVHFTCTVNGQTYGKEDLNFAKDFANRIALTVENGRLHEEAQSEIKQRIEAEHKKDEFIGVASHELKTPITSLAACVQMLARLTKNDSESDIRQKLIENAASSVRKLSTLVKDLLNVSKIEGGQLSLNKLSFNLASVISNCCQHVRLTATHNIQIEGDLDLMVFADPLRLDQVVVNFIDNAVKYSSKNSVISVVVENLGEIAKVSVSDQGKGIPSEKLPYLFDRYYRVDTSGIQYSGLGLGLYISSEIVKLHDGEIGVYSNQGSGSTFWFTVPIDG
jgi:signal transduction histidine kinase